MGLLWGLCSVIITSVAQLGLSFAMANLPPMTQWQTFIPVLFSLHTGTLVLFTSLVGYLLS